LADSRLIDLSAAAGSDGPTEEPDAAFYFDLGNPEAWLLAERVIATLGRPAPWIPVLQSGIAAEFAPVDLEAIALTARERGLLELRPPQREQTDTRDAMLAATFARQSGKGVAFTLAAMRQCWCAGRDLADRTTLLLAGAAAEIHPNALEKAFNLKSLAAELDRETAAAVAVGVDRLPAVRIGQSLQFGDAGLEEFAR
jgi:2-hydroxychromene-2-carboxylate isomerase